MGPRLVSRGKWDEDPITTKGVSLQWGRDLLVAESTSVGRTPRTTQTASMGPRLVSRGTRNRTGLARCECQRLQWGRDLLVAESCLSCEMEIKGLLLQWGRDLLVAESLGKSRLKYCLHSSFNGAATC